MSIKTNQNTDNSVLRGRTLAFTIVFGGLSAVLYLLLFYFSAELVYLAQATKVHKEYAVVPLALAMLFVFVHNAFTDNLCDLLGLRVKN